MKIYTKIIAFLTSILLLVSGVQQSVIGFTTGDAITAQRHSYCFDNDKLLIGAYYADPNKIELASEAGIEFFIDSSVTKELLDECQKYSIGVIAGGYNLGRDYGTATDATISQWVNYDVKNYKNHPALWGDDLIDEPGAKSYDALAKAVNAYAGYNPDKLALINLFPIYASEEQLECPSKQNLIQQALLHCTASGGKAVDSYKQYVSEYINKIDTDYICVDIYPMHARLDKKGNTEKYTSGNWLNNLDILAEACRKTNRDLWVITQAAGQTKDGSGTESPRYCVNDEDISQQAYASLAFGAKAIIHAEFAAKGWWQSDSHMIDKDGNPTATYYAVKNVDSYLAKFAKEYGKYDYVSTYLLNTCRVAGYKMGLLANQNIDEMGNVKSLNGLAVGTFKSDEGKAYVVANMEELNNSVTATAVFESEKGQTVTVWQKNDCTVYAGGKDIKLTLEPGEGVYITVK